MASTIIFYSLSPVVIVVAGVSGVPFLFAAVMQVGGMIGYLLLLRGRYRSLLGGCYRSPEGNDLVKDAIKCNLLDFRGAGPLLVLGTLSGLDYVLFIYSTRFVDISIATVLFELWPLFSIPLTAVLTRRKKRYAKITLGFMLLLSGGFAGAAFVIASQSGQLAGVGDLSSVDLVIGTLLALLSAFAVALAVCLFRWSEDLVERLPKRVNKDRGQLDLELFAVAVAIVITDVFSITMNGVAGIATGEILAPTHIWVGLLFGFFVYFLGSLAWRASNLLTGDLGINALTYFTPLLALVWLWVYSTSNLPGSDGVLAIARVDYLIIGAAAIVSFNLLLNFEAENLLGFKSLVISLWAGGALVFLRDPGRWTWRGTGVDYFDALALSATVFTLILSFRVARLVSRTTDEDNRTFALVRSFEDLSKRDMISPEVSKRILDIDAADGQELVASYDKAREYIADAIEKSSGPDRDRLIALEGELDSLAHSRQQGINFGEGCALLIFAGITVGLLILSRPAVAGLTGFLVEMMSVLFSAVIVFLTVNVLDLQRSRKAKVLTRRRRSRKAKGLTRRGSSSGYGVSFQNQTRRTVEQWLSLVVGLMIVLSYGALLADKWMCGSEEVVSVCSSWWGGIWVFIAGQ